MWGKGVGFVGGSGDDFSHLSLNNSTHYGIGASLPINVNSNELLAYLASVLEVVELCFSPKYLQCTHQ